MFGEAFKSPARSSDALPTILVGGFMLALALILPGVVGVVATRESVLALAALPVAALPGLVLAGYALRVAAAGARGERAAPSFVDWGGLVRGGLGALVVSAWWLVPLVVLAVAGFATVFGFTTDVGRLPESELGQSVTALATVGAGAAYLLTYAYVWPAALTAYAAGGRLRSGFDPRTVLGVALSTRYLLGWALAAASLLVVGVPAVLLASVLVGLFPLFYLLASVASLVGRASGRGLDVERVDAADAADATDAADADEVEGEPDDADATESPRDPEASDERAAGGATDGDGPLGAASEGDGAPAGAGPGPEPSTADGAPAAARTNGAGDAGPGPGADADADPDADGAGGAEDDDGPATLEGYEVAEPDASADRLGDPDDALSAFDAGDLDEPDAPAAADGDATVDADGDDDHLGSTPLGPASRAAENGDRDATVDEDATVDGAATVDEDATVDGDAGGGADGDDDDGGFEWGRVDGA